MRKNAPAAKYVPGNVHRKPYQERRRSFTK
jgi:hypothetical protein